MTAGSALDQDLLLADLLDLPSLHSIARTFSELHGIGFQLVEAGGALLHETGSTHLLCRLLNQGPEGAQACAAKLAVVRSLSPEVGGGAVAEDCFTGFRYQATALTFDGGALGAVIVGPYLPGADAPRRLPEAVVPLVGERLAKAEALYPAAPTMSDAHAKTVLDHARTLLGSLIHAGAARHYTSAMHSHAVKESHRELEDRNHQVAELIERLKEADRLKANFLATMSHELRTPLTSVIGYSEMLLGGLAGELAREQRDYVQTIMDKGEQLLGLISSLIDTARAGSGVMRVRREAIDVAEIVRAVMALVAPVAERRRLILRTDVAPDLPRAQADREKLRQVVLNLVGNAVKFTPESGTVTVAVQLGLLDERGPAATPFAENDAVKLTVTDTGIGIGKQHLGRVFEPFYQADGTSTREYSGAGIGLALVRSYVQAMGGFVSADSIPGKGSTFTVTLPLAERPNA